MQNMSDDPNAMPAIGVSFQIGLDPQKQIVFQTHFAQDASDSQINVLMDKLWRAGKRLETRALCAPLERQIEIEERTLRDQQKELAKLDLRQQTRQSVHEQQFKESGRRGAAPALKPAANEDEVRANIVKTIEVLGEKVAKFKVDLARMQKESADVGDGGANRGPSDSDREVSGVHVSGGDSA